MTPQRIAALRAVLGIPAADMLVVLAWDIPGKPEGWRLAAVGKGRVRGLGDVYFGASAPAVETFLEALELGLREAPESPGNSAI